MRNELLGTASVNLSNVLKNNGGKSTYDEGVADMIHLWGWGEEFQGLDFSPTPRIDLAMQFPPGPGAAVTVPCGMGRGGLGGQSPALPDSASFVPRLSWWDAVMCPLDPFWRLNALPLPLLFSQSR